MTHTPNRTFAIAAAIATVAALSSPALADGSHGQQASQTGAQHGMMGDQEGMSGMMGNMQMMQRMMQMHGQGGMMGSHQGKAGDMGYMNALAAFADGDPSAIIEDFDIDGDGALSIAEFETLHSAAIREMMVNRFQAIDNDGDGQISAEELTAAAEQMAQMGQGGMMGGQGGHGGQSGMMGGNSNGPMMQNQNN